MAVVRVYVDSHVQGENWELQLRALSEKVHFQDFLLTAQMTRWMEDHPSCRTCSAGPLTELDVALAIALFLLLIVHGCHAWYSWWREPSRPCKSTREHSPGRT